MEGAVLVKAWARQGGKVTPTQKQQFRDLSEAKRPSQICTALVQSEAAPASHTQSKRCRRNLVIQDERGIPWIATPENSLLSQHLKGESHARCKACQPYQPASHPPGDEELSAPCTSIPPQPLILITGKDLSQLLAPCRFPSQRAERSLLPSPVTQQPGVKNLTEQGAFRQHPVHCGGDGAHCFCRTRGGGVGLRGGGGEREREKGPSPLCSPASSQVGFPMRV